MPINQWPSLRDQSPIDAIQHHQSKDVRHLDPRKSLVQFILRQLAQVHTKVRGLLRKTLVLRTQKNRLLVAGERLHLVVSEP